VRPDPRYGTNLAGLGAGVGAVGFGYQRWRDGQPPPEHSALQVGWPWHRCHATIAVSLQSLP
jgi:hypothetical protein